MSHLEQDIRSFLSMHPEIEKCISHNLVNRRSLARHIIKNKVADKGRLDAVIATLRRIECRKFSDEDSSIFTKVRLRVKDNIAILDFEKDKKLMQELKKIIDSANYDKEETLKIVVGSASIKVFIDESNHMEVKRTLQDFELNKEHMNISEISMIFPKQAVSTKGIISFISRELYLNDITINEILTASPELLIYLKEDYAAEAYKIIKRLQK